VDEESSTCGHGFRTGFFLKDETHERFGNGKEYQYRNFSIIRIKSSIRIIISKY